MMTDSRKIFLDTAPLIFLTNDKQLKQFQEIPCVLVGEQMG